MHQGPDPYGWHQRNGHYAPSVPFAQPPERNKALATQRGMLTAMLPLHVLMFFAEVLSLTVIRRLDTIRDLESISSGATPFEQGELVGRLLAAGCFLLWGSFGFVWALLNLLALNKPAPTHRTSLQMYWLFSIVSCLCFPIGIFGLINLSKPEVRSALR